MLNSHCNDNDKKKKKENIRKKKKKYAATWTQTHSKGYIDHTDPESAVLSTLL